MTETEPQNKLAHETSPYLLQHADNPVPWLPWGAEAFERAKREDKPIFLSIGYSSCHWCHVMEHESFEDEETAALMNELFVCIKVDREERPDVDATYMNAVQLMTGSGGWPLSVWLTPDLEPYLGGTYFPPEDRAGRPGLKTVLRYAADVYREQPDQVARVTGQIRGRLGRLAAGPEREAEIDRKFIEAALGALHTSFDETWGGFGPAPKFPPTGALALLLRHHHRTGDERSLKMATVTLDRMARGGLYDQLGGGFHRYSVDRAWLVPHFEKMLYDNALLAMVYLDAWRVTRKPLYRRAARETLDYVLRDLVDEAGGFHSARDADSQGVEGKYYVWTASETEDVLGEDAELFNAFYGVTEAGNFEGKNILHVPVPLDAFAEARGLEPDALREKLDAMKGELLDARRRRVPPGKDDKVLADWNGLMISATARGAAALGDERYGAAAERAAEFVFDRMRPDGDLLHTYRAGTAHVDAFLRDYAFLLQAAVDLYEATFKPTWIDRAESLAAEMTEKLWDDEAGGFFSRAGGGHEALVREKDAHDGAVPAGNAIAAHALLRLGTLTMNDACRTKGERALRLFVTRVERGPQAYARLLCAADFHLGPRREIVVAGQHGEAATERLLAAVRSRYLPDAVVAAVRPGSDIAGRAIRRVPMLAGRELVDGRPAAYVCENYACRRPVTTPEELAELLAKRWEKE